ncbi:MULTISPECIES: hypothetical protein [unclassified Flavobacterium]|uniref:hypothetical protein n=1 Tax=unclassified Flavobacterium TaxID=196869 RepID=UPI0025C513DD|nr:MULTISPECIES: hypothetical protein [unclassified Flavobacterium]
MKKNIKNYVSLLDSEIKKEIQKEFNTEQEQFKSFKTFDFVNFHLINKIVLNENDKDCFISIPEDDYRPNFFASIFHSLVLIKLYQNFFNFSKTKPALDLKDLIYTKYQNQFRVCEIKSVYNDNIKINLKFPKKNEHFQNFDLKGRNFTKLNPNLVDNKNTAKNITVYNDFLLSNFTSDFPFITDFKSKSLVIADKRFFKESKFLPINYTNKNGKISNDLPFFNYLIESCNDFKTAKDYLLDENQTFDEIIVIGDSKYRECFSDILQEAKWLGKVKNIILIGTEKPITGHIFTEWLWSKDEIKIANSEIPKTPQKVVLENDYLILELGRLKDEIENIKKVTNVNLSHLLIYANFYFRIILVNTNLSKGIYREYSDRLYQYFKSDKFEEEMSKNFFGQDIYNKETIKNHTEKILNKFKCISDILENQNLKWNYIKNKAKEVNNLYLIVEKKNFDAVENQIKNERISNIRLISDKRIDCEKQYLDKWINDIKNTENQTYIIPYLNNTELLDKINLLKGNCEVLCYKEIDEISFDNLLGNYYRTEKDRLIHRDRNQFVKTEFSFIEQVLQRNLDDLFKFDFENENFKNDPYESIDVPKEKVNYEIEFTDGTSDKFDSSKGVFLIDKEQLIKTNIGEIFEGATIRFYQNNNPNDFKKTLKIFDIDKQLESFDSYSESWKETLKKLSTKFNGIENLYSRLYNQNYKINLNTFKHYFEENSSTRFPRIKTLEIIKDFCITNNFKEELIVNEFEKFKIYSKKDHSIRQQVGRVLGSDLIDFVASNETEISESLKKIPMEILNKLIETIQEKTIKKKTLLEDE